MNPDVQGKAYPPITFEVSAERVAAFRDLFGHPGGVPPTLVTAAEFAAFPPLIEDPALALDFARVLHGSQDYEYRRPLREGEMLTVTARIESIKLRGGTGFLTVAMDLAGADGVTACVARTTLVERPA